MMSDQQAARVNVSEDEWIEFRTLGCGSAGALRTTSVSSSGVS